MKSVLRVLFVMLLSAASPPDVRAADAPAPKAEPKVEPIIVFMTDFGTLDDAVAICKGVMLSLAPGARIVDLTHQVPPYSIADGARFLARTSLYYPANTIFVGVVDPGVGTERRTIIARSKRGQFFVVPDNGLLTPIEDRDGIEGVREITNAEWMLPKPHSATFQGRDVFSAAAGHLARGDDWSAAGPSLAKLARLSIAAPDILETGIAGHVIGFDGPYGNLITDIKRGPFAALGIRLGDVVNITVGGKDFSLPFVKTFGDVPVGKPLLYIDSSELVSVAINQGSFAQVHDIAPPAPFIIARPAKKPH